MTTIHKTRELQEEQSDDRFTALSWCWLINWPRCYNAPLTLTLLCCHSNAPIDDAGVGMRRECQCVRKCGGRWEHSSVRDGVGRQMANMMLFFSDTKNGMRRETRWEKLDPHSSLLSTLLIRAYLSLLQSMYQTRTKSSLSLQEIKCDIWQRRFSNNYVYFYLYATIIYIKLSICYYHIQR